MRPRGCRIGDLWVFPTPGFPQGADELRHSDLVWIGLDITGGDGVPGDGYWVERGGARITAQAGTVCHARGGHTWGTVSGQSRDNRTSDGVECWQVWCREGES